MKKNVAVVMGGYGSEFEISLKSGANVVAHLDPTKYEVYPIIISVKSWTYTTKDNKIYHIKKGDFSLELPHKQVIFDAVFIAMHENPANGKIQAYFDIINIPYTGLNFYKMALICNKRDLLSVLKPYQISMAKSYHVNYGDLINKNNIIKKVGLPCFVKANCSGSSYGISKVYTLEQFDNAFNIAFKEDNEVIVEEALPGREFTVGVITFKDKTVILPITEIVSENDFFDCQAKYEGKSKYITPAVLDFSIETKIKDTAKFIYDILKLTGLTRFDFILVNDIPHLLEINSVPGLSKISLFPQQLKVANISLSDLFDDEIFKLLTIK